MKLKREAVRSFFKMTIKRPDGKVVFDGYKFDFGWLSAGFHVFRGPDDLGCYHSHPGTAFRLVLWGGYVEEYVASNVRLGDRCRICNFPVEARSIRGRFECECGFTRMGDPRTKQRTWFPGRFGIVRPEFEHRIHRLLGKRSVSLWVRGPITHKIKTRGC